MKPQISPLALSIVGSLATTIPCAAWMIRQTSPATDLKPKPRTANSLPVTANSSANTLSDRLQGIRANLFGEPEPAPVTAPKKPTMVKTEAVVPTPPTVPDPYADWKFTATASVGGEEMALLENRKTGEGRYVKLGEGFEGGSVKSVTKDQLVIADASGTHSVQRFGDWSLTPLSKPKPEDGRKIAGAVDAEQRNVVFLGGERAIVRTLSFINSPVTVTKKDRDKHFEGKTSGKLLRQELESKRTNSNVMWLDSSGIAGKVRVQLGGQMIQALPSTDSFSVMVEKPSR